MNQANYGKSETQRELLKARQELANLKNKNELVVHKLEQKNKIYIEGNV